MHTSNTSHASCRKRCTCKRELSAQVRHSTTFSSTFQLFDSAICLRSHKLYISYICTSLLFSNFFWNIVTQYDLSGILNSQKLLLSIKHERTTLYVLSMILHVDIFLVFIWMVYALKIHAHLSASVLILSKLLILKLQER